MSPLEELEALIAGSGSTDDIGRVATAAWRARAGDAEALRICRLLAKAVRAGRHLDGHGLIPLLAEINPWLKSHDIRPRDVAEEEL